MAARRDGWLCAASQMEQIVSQPSMTHSGRVTIATASAGLLRQRTIISAGCMASARASDRVCPAHAIVNEAHERTSLPVSPPSSPSCSIKRSRSSRSLTSRASVVGRRAVADASGPRPTPMKIAASSSSARRTPSALRPRRGGDLRNGQPGHASARRQVRLGLGRHDLPGRGRRRGRRWSRRAPRCHVRWRAWRPPWRRAPRALRRRRCG